MIFAEYEAIKLIRDVTSRANVALEEFRTNLTVEQVKSIPTYLSVSTYSMKNTRRKMEDRHIVLQDLNTLYDMKVSKKVMFQIKPNNKKIK